MKKHEAIQLFSAVCWMSMPLFNNITAIPNITDNACGAVLETLRRSDGVV